jgi:hypothetical protein
MLRRALSALTLTLGIIATVGCAQEGQATNVPDCVRDKDCDTGYECVSNECSLKPICEQARMYGSAECGTAAPHLAVVTCDSDKDCWSGWYCEVKRFAPGPNQCYPIQPSF